MKHKAEPTIPCEKANTVKAVRNCSSFCDGNPIIDLNSISGGPVGEPVIQIPRVGGRAGCFASAFRIVMFPSITAHNWNGYMQIANYRFCDGSIMPDDYLVDSDPERVKIQLAYSGYDLIEGIDGVAYVNVFIGYPKDHQKCHVGFSVVFSSAKEGPLVHSSMAPNWVYRAAFTRYVPTVQEMLGHGRQDNQK